MRNKLPIESRCIVYSRLFSSVSSSRLSSPSSPLKPLPLSHHSHHLSTARLPPLTPGPPPIAPAKTPQSPPEPAKPGLQLVPLPSTVGLFPPAIICPCSRSCVFVLFLFSPLTILHLYWTWPNTYATFSTSPCLSNPRRCSSCRPSPVADPRTVQRIQRQSPLNERRHLRRLLPQAGRHSPSSESPHSHHLFVPAAFETLTATIGIRLLAKVHS